LEKHGEEMNFFGWFMVEEELKTLWDCASTIWYSNFAIFFHHLCFMEEAFIYSKNGGLREIGGVCERGACVAV
jgi:hypothetical protein